MLEARLNNNLEFNALPGSDAVLHGLQVLPFSQAALSYQP